MNESHRMWAALDIEARERQQARPKVPPRLGVCLAWAVVLFVASFWLLWAGPGL